MEIIIDNVQRPLACFAKLQSYQHLVYRLIKEFNADIVPLGVVGTFFNYVGNHLLHDIQGKLKEKPIESRQVFYPKHEVVGITLLKDGYHLVTCKRLESTN